MVFGLRGTDVLVRIAAAGLFLPGAVDEAELARIMVSHGVLPDRVILAVARILWVLEAFVIFALVVGLIARRLKGLSVVPALTLLVVFTCYLASVVAWGQNQAECGCSARLTGYRTVSTALWQNVVAITLLAGSFVWNTLSPCPAPGIARGFSRARAFGSEA